jgi:hypothetical protein
MIHYSCDRCKRLLDPTEDLRYVVKIEVQAALEPACPEVEEDRDHLLEVHEILERLEDEESDAVSEEIYQRKRFDLCPTCYRQFMKNPLGREQKKQLGFSKN